MISRVVQDDYPSNPASSPTASRPRLKRLNHSSVLARLISWSSKTCYPSSRWTERSWPKILKWDKDGFANLIDWSVRPFAPFGCLWQRNCWRWDLVLSLRSRYKTSEHAMENRKITKTKMAIKTTLVFFYHKGIVYFEFIKEEDKSLTIHLFR